MEKMRLPKNSPTLVAFGNLAIKWRQCISTEIGH